MNLNQGERERNGREGGDVGDWIRVWRGLKIEPAEIFLLRGFSFQTYQQRLLRNRHMCAR